MRLERYWHMVMAGLCLMLAALACTNPLSGNPQVEEAEETAATEEIEETEEAAEEAVEAEEAAETEEVIETEEAVEAEAPEETEEVEETEEAEETEEPTVETEASQSETPDSPTPTASPDLTPTPEPEIDLPQTYHNQEGGYSLSLPAAWVTMEFDMIAYAAPNQDAIDQLNTDGAVTTPAIMVVVGPPDLLDFYGEANTANDIARQVIAEMKEDTELTVGKPSNLTVGGLEAATFDISGPDEVNGQLIATRMIIVVGTEQSGLFYGISLLVEWEEFSPIFDAIIDSVEFSGYTQ